MYGLDGRVRYDKTGNQNVQLVLRIAAKRMGHFTVMDGKDAGVDLVVKQTFMLYSVQQVSLMLTNIFEGQFP